MGASPIPSGWRGWSCWRVGAAATAEQIALCAVQAQAIRLDPGFRGGDYYDAPAGQGPERGLGLARRIGHISYRSRAGARRPASAANRRAGEDPLTGGRYAVESYLDHQADKAGAAASTPTATSSSAGPWTTTTSDGIGGASAAALRRVQAAPTVIGVDSDRLYPLRLQHELASLLPGQPEVQTWCGRRTATTPS